MPRPKRPILTEQPYHVYNRGNYKAPVFESKGAVDAFLKALDETVCRFEWKLYAFAIMPNHYHLCVRTPLGNLSEGMHHLLTAFCTRYNRFRKENGHVFQGRFHAKVAPKGISVRRIIDYIHLNPARAGLVSLEQTARMDVTSLRDYLTLGRRPYLSVPEAFERFIGFLDDEEGRAAYRRELEKEVRVSQGDPDYEKDWKHAAREERRESRRKSGGLRPERRLSREEVMRAAEARWETCLSSLLTADGLTEADLARMPKRDPRKLAIARGLVASGARLGWIAPRIKAGSCEYLRNNLGSWKGSGPHAV